MLIRHGNVIAEGWWDPYNAQSPHMMFSVSKSFTSTAVGFAVQEGLLSTGDRIVSFFSDDIPADPSEWLQAMRVRDLLTMSTGQEQDRIHQFTTGNWVREFLAEPIVEKPGTTFRYSSGATYMLAAILQNVTGKSLMDYLTPRLFDPIGIKGASWETCPAGINLGGWGLKITTEDLARFGELYLKEGAWNGTRIIGKAWIKLATSKQIDNGTQPKSDWAKGYGYQFWRCRHKAYRADGALGQLCVVMPEQDAVLAITSATHNFQALVGAIWAHILGHMKSSRIIENAADLSLLKSRLACLALDARESRTEHLDQNEISDQRYVATANGDTDEITAARWHFGIDQSGLTLDNALGTHTLTFSLDKWLPGTTTFPENAEVQVACRGAWTKQNTFSIKVCHTETPFTVTIEAVFLNDSVHVSSTQNATFGDALWPEMNQTLRLEQK